MGTLRYHLIICQRFPLACFNSDQIDKGPPVYQQIDAELQESKQQLRKSEVANNQSWVRSIKDLCPNFKMDGKFIWKVVAHVCTFENFSEPSFNNEIGE